MKWLHWQMSTPSRAEKLRKKCTREAKEREWSLKQSSAQKKSLRKRIEEPSRVTADDRSLCLSVSRDVEASLLSFLPSHSASVYNYLARGSAAILSSPFLAFIFAILFSSFLALIFAILLGWPFLVFTSFPSMREIPFIGSLSTTPTWIGPFFHLDFRVILHSGIFILFPSITLYQHCLTCCFYGPFRYFLS